MTKIQEMEKNELNSNIFSTYDFDALSLQELLNVFYTRINECIKLANKADSIIDYLVGEGLNLEVAKKLEVWINDGTLEEIINQEVFTGLNEKITQTENNVNNIEENIPYKDFKDGDQITSSDNSKIYEGNSVFAAKTYGRFERGSVVSAIAGEDNPRVEVLGTDTKGLSKYESRDSVALYFHNNSDSNDTFNVVGATFTLEGCTLPLGIDMSKIKVGMIVDTTTDPHCVGIIQEIQGNELIMEDGWYQIKPGVGSTVKTVPIGNTCTINPKTKVWGSNGNVFIRPGIASGVNMELGVFCNHTEIEEVGGIDLVNFEGSTHFGYKARGKEFGFQKGFISEGSGVHFEGKGGNSSDPLIQAINKDNSVFVMKNDGEVSKVKTVVQTIPSSTTLADNVSVGLISGSNVTVTLPRPERGRILYFYSLGTGNKLLAHPGQTITFPHVSHQEIPLGSKACSCQLVSDGTNWYAIATTITE